MNRHIGIVACSPPGAALCYETICVSAGRRGESLEVSMHGHLFQDYMDCIARDDWNGVADLLLSSANKLSGLGAKLLVAPCNTIHAAFDRVLPRSPLPWLHIAEEVALEARKRGFRRIGLLGTQAIMEGSIYRDQFARFDIEQITPGAQARQQIDRIIFDELVNGVATHEVQTFFRALVKDMRDEGCDAIGVCCTELPLVLKEQESVLPLLDSTRLLALAAIDKCGSAVRECCWVI